MKHILIILLLSFWSLSSSVAQTTQTLVPVGNGINSTYGIYGGTVVYNNKLYASDGTSIFTWDGSNWNTLSVSANSWIMCMEVYNGKLYAAGWFTTFNGMPANRIVSYDGTNWNTLGTGIGVDPNVTGGVEKMTTYNNELVVLGGFITAGSQPANHIAKWNGNTWSTLGSGVTGVASIPSMLTYNNELYVFSQINNAGGIPVSGAAKWNGTNWSGVGNGLQRWAISSVVYNNEIYVGQWISNGDSTSTLTKWNGFNWVPVETNLNDTTWTIPADLKVFNGNLYMAGVFRNINGVSVNSLARFDGNNWYPVGDGVNNTANFLTEYNNELYVTGRFQFSGTTQVRNVAKIQNGTALGILESNSKYQSLRVYPNPVSDVLHFQKPSNGFGKSNYRITNSLGQIIQKGSTKNNQISVENLDKGLFIITIEENGKLSVSRFIKE